MYAIIDCNNFYASCERVFNPHLRHTPVVILSNNDGCIIARSNEAKALGIDMGGPFYQVKEILEQNNVAIFSSNYNLYGDMSRRVMRMLFDFCPNGFTQYSIDEAFLNLEGMGSAQDLHQPCIQLAKDIERGTGIPVTIGIAPTKTLAKMASKFGKKHKGYQGCCMIDTEEKRQKALQLFPIGDVWGIGWHFKDKLDYYSIKTAWDFTQQSEAWVRKLMHVPGVRTWKELQGIDCIDIEELPHKKSIMTSRSFQGEGLSELADVEEAVANFAASCVRKLREQHTCCSALMVFAHTSRFRTDLPSNYIYRNVTLQVPTNNLQEIVSTAVKALRTEWKPGNFFYKKAGVMVWDICRDDAIQTALFDPIDRSKQASLAKAIDEINRKNGHNMVRVAVQGYSKNWHLKNEYLSRQYTTNLDQIIEAKAD
ncbi:MAG: Y-family DNA polymerase [Bacteroidaceae bacterium]|nr:Y-family DNA polymerase [Bacteroidaceae bacterium]